MDIPDNFYDDPKKTEGEIGFCKNSPIYVQAHVKRCTIINLWNRKQFTKNPHFINTLKGYLATSPINIPDNFHEDQIKMGQVA